MKRKPAMVQAAGQAAKGKPGGLLVVHRIHAEHAAAVEVALDRLVGHRDVALNIAAVAVVVAQSLHIQHGDDELVGVGALLRQLGRAVQHGRQGCVLVHLIQHRDVLFRQFDGIGHFVLPLFRQLVSLAGRPKAARRAASESPAGGLVPVPPA